MNIPHQFKQVGVFLGNEGFIAILKIVIIAGPNGAGKTIFAREFLPNEVHCPIFITADLVAAGLSSFQPEKAVLRAGRLMLDERCREAMYDRKNTHYDHY